MSERELPIESFAIAPFDKHGKPLDGGPIFYRYEPIHPQYAVVDDVEESEDE